MEMPSRDELVRWIDLLSSSDYSATERHKASAWATPILINVGAPNPAVSTEEADALFLLGAADLKGEADRFVYGSDDFIRVRDSLLKQPDEQETTANS